MVATVQTLNGKATMVLSDDVIENIISRFDPGLDPIDPLSNTILYVELAGGSLTSVHVFKEDLGSKFEFDLYNE